MDKTALLSLLAGVSVPFADAGMPPNSPSEWNPCTITTTLPPSQVVTQAPRVTMTLDEHDKFVKASRQTTSAISPNQPTPSPASSPPTNTSVTGINESEFPISTALFEPFSALVNTLPSSGLKTTPPDATGSETSVRVHTQKTQPHSVITFVTHTRKEDTGSIKYTYKPLKGRPGQGL
ncbi:hypothetical protein CDV36_002730 [Fusarium kuroshium]|uniref:Uncharacterized protein n=1 Tax=Fusarium kuroshium TaxID=2010991 RepID=A0A3M2SJ46_9HYPO|nr:hypothetical protein CDV36_002730 [Fusarium kuroshium]